MVCNEISTALLYSGPDQPTPIDPAEQLPVNEFRAGERGRHDEAADEREEREEEVVVAERNGAHLRRPLGFLRHSRWIVLKNLRMPICN